MIKTAENELESESRRTARTHMFVAATLYSGGASRLVRVRNMSRTGALIEGDEIPSSGSALALRRGSLHAHGEIAWKSGRKAGIVFQKPVVVRDWLTSVGAPKQARVDAVAAEIKPAAQRFQGSAPSPEISEDVDHFPCQLQRLKTDLEQVAASLARDPKVMAAHPEIQTLNLCLQRIDGIIAMMRSRA